MIELIFHAEEGTAGVSVGDTFSILLADGCLSAGGGPVLASHVDGRWHIGQTGVPRITCKGPIALDLEMGGERRRYGPFTDLVIGDNSIWTTGGAFARYNSFTKKWSLVAKDLKNAVVPERITLVNAA
jgi:hypothetical protein